MSEDDRSIHIMGHLFTGLAIAVLVIFLIAQSCVNNSMKASAVKRGAAEWKVNQETGSTTFQWKDLPQSTDSKP